MTLLYMEKRYDSVNRGKLWEALRSGRILANILTGKRVNTNGVWDNVMVWSNKKEEIQK